MKQTFTASEVRDAITWKYGDKSTRISAMLNAFADLLEAQEKAVPVKLEYYDAGLLNNFGGGNIDRWWDYIRNELGRAHSFYQSQVDGIMSAPSDAERLAEALRMCMDIMLEHGVPIHPDADARVAYTAAEQALAAHSAQAQPQNGDWVLVPRDPTHAMRESAASYGGRGGYNKQRGDDAMEVWRDMLAAVPQPPAARVPDWTDAQCVAFMAVGLRHTEYKKGKSPTVEEIRQGAKAALAAQENPNG